MGMPEIAPKIAKEIRISCGHLEREKSDCPNSSVGDCATRREIVRSVSL